MSILDKCITRNPTGDNNLIPHEIAVQTCYDIYCVQCNQLKELAKIKQESSYNLLFGKKYSPKYHFFAEIGGKQYYPKGIYYQGKKHIILVGDVNTDSTVRRKELIDDVKLSIVGPGSNESAIVGASIKLAAEQIESLLGETMSLDIKHRLKLIKQFSGRLTK